MCALAGRLGRDDGAWRWVPSLPFELAVWPHHWFRWLGLPVVSYAMPALIAIGQARHHHRPTRNPLTRCLRDMVRERTLQVLMTIQPNSGGFIEAIPLTSFVVMSLASIGRADHAVTRKGTAFLIRSARSDGSWPIDTNLATWLTTLSVNGLTDEHEGASFLLRNEHVGLLAWLLKQQHRVEHPYTHAAPGGWGWTDLSGGVPDADDTAGVLLALRRLATAMAEEVPLLEKIKHAAEAGVRWLLDLQNRDGGVPTFCKGWGRLPFDRSCPDLTGHALRAWRAWRPYVGHELRARVDQAATRAIEHLVRTQRADGTWVPLWFGNQHVPDQANPLYGTTRVLRAGPRVARVGLLAEAWSRARRRAIEWVLHAQHACGGWGGAAGVDATVEETALAVEALADCCSRAESGQAELEPVRDALGRGASWLAERTAGGTRFDPAPIGLYFAKLWYSERLYPVIFTVSALQRARRILAQPARLPDAVAAG
jgi:squalene-hopene/tetraprenyl-beta-curcumene cyclase